MTLRLVIEAAPRPQAVSEREFTGGRMTIGRGEDADWQLDDPKMFVSRRHCVLTEENGHVIVTDASSGGLFVDNAANPVGTGNAVPVEPGMRLHLGDFVLRVEAARDAAAAAAPAGKMGGFFTEEPIENPVEPVAERPRDLPDPFGLRRDGSLEPRHKEVSRQPRPLDQRDPFDLDLRAPVDAPAETPPQPAASDAPPHRAAGGYFAAPDDEAAPPPTDDAPRSASGTQDIFGLGDRLRGTETDAETPADAGIAATPGTVADPPGAGIADSALRDALLRGMGLDPATMPPDDPVAEMENIGRCMRDLTEGLMLLLRTRAQEKQKVRVAQTIISSADVNPLKFLATPEDALQALVRPRGRGYLGPQDAVRQAFRDLTDHQLRTWSALQTALRRMVDRFDPEEIERQMAGVGLLELLVAGGRKAKLWQIYEDRYREIADSAEKQFLGDVGADFRDAYESKGS